jgi:hypothetical protein
VSGGGAPIASCPIGISRTGSAGGLAHPPSGPSPSVETFSHFASDRDQPFSDDDQGEVIDAHGDQKLRQRSCRPEDAGSNCDRRNDQNSSMESEGRSDRPFLVAQGEFMETTMNEDWLKDKDNEREQRPDDDHEIQPPERRLSKSRPGVEPHQHI